MVSFNSQSSIDAPKELWWGHSPTTGWVVQDRSLFVNRCWDYPEEMLLTRCSDGCEFEQGDRRWDYKEASRYLESLSTKDALEKRAELECFKAFFCERYEEVA